MKWARTGCVGLLFLGWIAGAAPAATFLPQAPDDQVAQAGAICRGTVVQSRCYRDPATGFIFTRTLVRVDEPLKGRFPAVVALVHRGGTLDGEGETDGFAPQLRVGGEHWFFLGRRADGTLEVPRGCAGVAPVRGPNDPWRQFIRQRVPVAAAAGMDVTDQAAAVDPTSEPWPLSTGTSSVSGLLTDGAGIAPRFLACDRGEPIPYLVDAEALPPGITLAQATNAVRVAFQAWAAVTSLQFVFEGMTNFGQSARDVVAQDGRIRIQLHDLYGEITNATTLAVGGRGFSFNDTLFPGGGFGGRVGSNEFHRTTRGFVVIKHTATALQTLSTLEEILAHEIGHTLSLAHSSETNPESNPVLAQALMYYLVHGDGRGAALTAAYDQPTVQQAHPPGNTPPYGYDRVIYGVTYPPGQGLAHPEVNQVEMVGYDRQGGTLTRSLTNQAGTAGSFSLAGPLLTFAPAALSTGDPLDPAGNGYYVRVYSRFDDGTNASPYILTRVIALLPDTWPAGAPDGVPDGWMSAHFGSPDASGANLDPDGDGETNVREFQSHTDPKDPGSCFRTTSYDGQVLGWSARPFELYEVRGTTNLVTWSRIGNPRLVSNTVGQANVSTGGVSALFLQIRKVP